MCQGGCQVATKAPQTEAMEDDRHSWETAGTWDWKSWDTPVERSMDSKQDGNAWRAGGSWAASRQVVSSTWVAAYDWKGSAWGTEASQAGCAWHGGRKGTTVAPWQMRGWSTGPRPYQDEQQKNSAWSAEDVQGSSKFWNSAAWHTDCMGNEHAKRSTGRPCTAESRQEDKEPDTLAESPWEMTASEQGAVELQTLLLGEHAAAEAGATFVEVFSRTINIARSLLATTSSEDQIKLKEQAEVAMLGHIASLRKSGYGWPAIYNLHSHFQPAMADVWTRWVEVAHFKEDPVAWKAYTEKHEGAGPPESPASAFDAIECMLHTVTMDELKAIFSEAAAFELIERPGWAHDSSNNDKQSGESKWGDGGDWLGSSWGESSNQGSKHWDADNTWDSSSWNHWDAEGQWGALPN